jgi:SAP domain-containing ribonucleoprotein
MVDYASQTVPKLQELLKSRQLSHTGKKAELIERLNEADKAAEANGTRLFPYEPSLRHL